MKDYKTLETVSINADRIRLTDDQARHRMNALKKTKQKGIYEPTENLTFKAGEVIGLENISKCNIAKLECLDKEETKPQDKTPSLDPDKSGGQNGKKPGDNK